MASTTKASSTTYVGEIFAIALDIVWFWVYRFLHWLILKRLEVRKLYRQLNASKSYKEWRAVAKKLDTLEGKDSWKTTDDSSLFDSRLIGARLMNLAEARASGDIDQIVFVLRAGLIRNIGGIGNPKLYAHCLTGTKTIIEEARAKGRGYVLYHVEVERLLTTLRETESESFSSQAKYEMLVECQQSFGRTALVLAGGAALGVYHLGVVRALLEANMLPRVIYGTSVGAMVAALICSYPTSELPQLFERGGLNLSAFFQPKPGKPGWSVSRRLNRLLKHGVLMDVSILETAVRDNIGDTTFEEAFKRTGRILNITVDAQARNQPPVLLNYLTAPDVVVRSAACASCAIPGLYDHVPLLAKDHTGQLVKWNYTGHAWHRQSIESELPSSRLSELFNVNHFILSQMSPHIVPLLPRSSMKFRDGPGALIKTFIRSELKHRLGQLAEIGVLPNWTVNLLNTVQQIYMGDIIIVPNITMSDLRDFLRTPTDDFLQVCILRGQQSTWPQLNLIRGHLAVENCLERLVEELRQELDVQRRAESSQLPVPPIQRRRRSVL